VGVRSFDSTMVDVRLIHRSICNLLQLQKGTDKMYTW
jgi:hypothetical protein